MKHALHERLGFARFAGFAPFAGLAGLAAFALFAAGCGSDRIDPPPDGTFGDDVSTEDAGDPDSLVSWAKRAREGWASGDAARADVASALARDAFAATWADLAQAKGDEAHEGERAERLPVRITSASPDADAVTDGLARIGLAADIVVADGTSPLWQVIIRDPTGNAGSLTEFYAWPDPAVPLGEPIVQSLPANAPARAHHGPDAVGALVAFSQKDGAGLASAWARPRGRVGLEVGLGKRGAKGAAARTWKVDAKRSLPIAVDSVHFELVGSGVPPVLVVVGAGARDPLFDDCPTCPRLERVQRYQYRGESWTLASEAIKKTPYASFVSFLHAMSEGTPESALPYADGSAVIDQAMTLGLDRRPPAPLRAALGTTATDLTQRYRIGPQNAIEVTLQPRGQDWVVVDVRETSLAIE